MMQSLIFALLLGPSQVAVPQPGTVKTFGDWAVGCDNIKNCQAVSLLPEDASFDEWDGPVTLIRSAGSDDSLIIRGLIEAKGIDRYQIWVDGELADTGAITEGDYAIEIGGTDAQKVASAIAKGRELVVKSVDGDILTTISLKGSSAALRYIDAQQGRARTRTALVATGSHDFSPEMIQRPQIAVASWEKSELVPSTEDIVALVENSDCKDERFGVTEDRAYSLGEKEGVHRALVLISCGSGAYNFTSAPFIGKYDDTGRGTKGWVFAPAKFDIAPGWGGAGRDPLLVNAYWSEEDATLGSYGKGRGLGDCGSSEQYVWDGAMFRLTEATTMPECRGAYEWIPVWQAVAVMAE